VCGVDFIRMIRIIVLTTCLCAFSLPDLCASKSERPSDLILLHIVSNFARVILIDFDLTVSIVHPMGGGRGIAASVFWIPSDRGIRKGQSCSSTLLRYYGTANYRSLQMAPAAVWLGR